MSFCSFIYFSVFSEFLNEKVLPKKTKVAGTESSASVSKMCSKNLFPERLLCLNQLQESKSPVVPEHPLPSWESRDNHAGTGFPYSDKADAAQRHTDRIPDGSQACLAPGCTAQDYWATQLASQGGSSFGDPEGAVPHQHLGVGFLPPEQEERTCFCYFKPLSLRFFALAAHLHGHLVREGLWPLRDCTMESGGAHVGYRALCHPLGQVQEGSTH